MANLIDRADRVWTLQAETVVRAAAAALRVRGLTLPDGTENRLIALAKGIRHHLETDDPPSPQ
jgi:hypothetical protein